MDEAMLFHDQLLATKFFVPSSSHPLIPRPQLTTLLNQGLRRKLTLISAPAGFGKTTLLSSWVQSLINTLASRSEQFLLVLDDYHVITKPEVHSSLTYLVEHLPPQLHLILATRADPPLPLSLLRARGEVLEVRTNQLRCTPEEVMAFFQEVMGMHLPADLIQEVTARTEGWLVGLQLLGLYLQGHTTPAYLLDEVNGSQRYILDYLMEEVLRGLPSSVQTFLVRTSILERLAAALSDAVLEQTNSQELLEFLERANVV